MKRDKYDSNIFNENNQTWFRFCKNCGKMLIYDKWPNFRKAEKRDKICKACANKLRVQSQDVLNKISEASKKTWADPNSKNRTEEVKQKRIAAFIETNQKHKEEGTLWYSETSKQANSEKIKKQRSDPNSKLNLALNSEEYRNALSEALKQAWADPNSGFNAPGFKENQFQNLMKGAFKLGLKTSKGEKELYDLVSHLGFIHNDFSIKIGKYFPDLINEDKKIIIEFYGDMFHANPSIRKYKDDDAIIKLPRGDIKAGDIRKYDLERNIYLESQGYKVHIVWQNEFKSNKNKVLEEIINLLGNIK